jgi:hypothetical protein
MRGGALVFCGGQPRSAVGNHGRRWATTVGGGRTPKACLREWVNKVKKQLFDEMPVARTAALSCEQPTMWSNLGHCDIARPWFVLDFYRNALEVLLVAPKLLHTKKQKTKKTSRSKPR